MTRLKRGFVVALTVGMVAAGAIFPGSSGAQVPDVPGCEEVVDCDPTVPPAPDPCALIVCPNPGTGLPSDPLQQPALRFRSIIRSDLTLNGDALQLSTPVKLTVGPDGSVTRTLLGSAGGGTIGTYNCVNDNSPSGFSAKAPKHMADNTAAWNYDFMWSLYQYNNSRFISGRGWMRQIEVCSTGGFDGKSGWRSYLVGQGQSYDPSRSTPANNAGKVYRIGSSWKSGATNGSTTRTLGFSVGGGKTPVSITGSISQTARDYLKGSYSPPYRTDMDSYSLNAANGWWEEDCYDNLFPCTNAGGSADFQGSTVLALWEFKMPKVSAKYVFPIEAYLDVACTNALAGCPNP